jgi:hypothetical protein
VIDVNAVYETKDPATVNSRVRDGWVLLSVAQDPYGDARYVLGRPRPAPGSGDEVSAPGEDEAFFPGPPPVTSVIVGLLRTMRENSGAPVGEPFGIPLSPADVDATGTLLSWSPYPDPVRTRAIVLEER